MPASRASRIAEPSVRHSDIVDGTQISRTRDAGSAANAHAISPRDDSARCLPIRSAHSFDGASRISTRLSKWSTQAKGSTGAPSMCGAVACSSGIARPA